MASSGIERFDRALGGGFPVPSAVLLEGSLGSAKEALLYSFIRKSVLPDRCIMVTKAGVDEVVRDARARGIEVAEGTAWVSGEGGEARVELENLASLSFSIKQIMKRNGGTRVRVAFDVLSALLMRNSSEGVYRFLDQLIGEVKKHNAVLLVTVESGMHSESVLTSIEHLFDGVLVVEPGSGQDRLPKIRVLKMKGVAISPNETVVLSEGEPERGVAKEERRLAAIMLTDMVGYTAITQRDESKAMEILQKQSSLLRPIFAKHGGREIKTIGDAFLLEFGSALQALECAVEVQDTLSKFNRAATTEESKLKIRIGIHLGDVIYSNNDIFGDAVNIASRIQPLAEPGGICVSDQVYGQVRNKTAYEMLKIEQVKLKNVSYPVDVYHLVLPWEPRPKVPVSGAESEGVPITRRLAILPLANLTPDSQDDYLADGMTEELITGLSNMKDLRVIARTSVIKYKGTTKGISEIAGELNVGCVVEGSIRKQGNKIRVHVVMVDGKSEEHLFATTYDRELQDVFAVQSDIAKLVSRAVKAKLRSVEKERMEKKPTQSVDAYSSYLKGRFVLHKRTKESMEEAVRDFLAAVAIDSHYAKAYAGLADAYLLLGSYGYLDAKQAYGVAKDYVSKALDLDDGIAEAHVSLGFLLETYYYDFVGARREFEKAVSISPSFAQARHWYAINLSIFGEVERAVSELEKAQEIDPLSPQITAILGGFYTYLKRNEDALFQWNKALMSDPDNIPICLNRGIFYAQLGRKEEALADVAKAVGLSSGAANVKCIQAFVDAVLGDHERALKTLGEVNEAARKEYVPPFYLAMVYSALGKADEAFAMLERSVDDRSVEVESLINDFMFEPIRQSPRYVEILTKIGVTKARMELQKDQSSVRI